MVGAECMIAAVIDGPGASGSWTWSDVERLVTEGADRAKCRRQVGGERGDRTVRRCRQAVAERCHEAGGWRAVARTEDARLVSLPPQLASQTEHLVLHTTRHGEAVGTDQTDAQR